MMLLPEKMFDSFFSLGQERLHKIPPRSQCNLFFCIHYENNISPDKKVDNNFWTLDLLPLYLQCQINGPIWRTVRQTATWPKHVSEFTSLTLYKIQAPIAKKWVVWRR